MRADRIAEKALQRRKLRSHHREGRGGENSPVQRLVEHEEKLVNARYHGVGRGQLRNRIKQGCELGAERDAKIDVINGRGAVHDAQDRVYLGTDRFEDHDGIVLLWR